MVHVYRKRTVLSLFALLLTYFLVFLYALYKLSKGSPVVDIGWQSAVINWLVIALSVIAIIRLVYEISRVEHAHAYEKRIGVKKA